MLGKSDSSSKLIQTSGVLFKLQNIKKNYLLGQTVVPALDNIDLQVNKGEFTAIVGASGSGKSTLLNIIGSIDDPDSGSYAFDQVDILKLTDIEKSKLRSEKIGFIFQSFNLIPVLTVYENVELPLLIHHDLSKADRHDRIMNFLGQVGLETLKTHLPDQLSGGQRQRVAIARALACHPLLVLADEPTANLDSKTSTKIIDLMLELNEKTHVTFLFSTHDERLMERVKRTIHIRDGILQE